LGDQRQRQRWGAGVCYARGHRTWCRMGDPVIYSHTSHPVLQIAERAMGINKKNCDHQKDTTVAACMYLNRAQFLAPPSKVLGMWIETGRVPTDASRWWFSLPVNENTCSQSNEGKSVENTIHSSQQSRFGLWALPPAIQQYLTFVKKNLRLAVSGSCFPHLPFHPSLLYHDHVIVFAVVAESSLQQNANDYRHRHGGPMCAACMSWTNPIAQLG